MDSLRIAVPFEAAHGSYPCRVSAGPGPDKMSSGRPPHVASLSGRWKADGMVRPRTISRCDVIRTTCRSTRR